jgi:hypothetical protein
MVHKSLLDVEEATRFNSHFGCVDNGHDEVQISARLFRSDNASFGG